MYRRLGTGLFLFCISAQAHAQIASNACLARDGRPIRIVIDNRMGWAGLARYEGNEPVIVWNEAAANRMPETERVFLYLHECAHHTLGHLYTYDGAPQELEADCWAIQLMVDGGMVNGNHVAELERGRRNVRADTAHLGGEAHIKSLRDCLDARTDRKAWSSALNAFVAAAADSFRSASGRVLEVDDAGAPTVVESRLDAPGTYDCEVLHQSAIRCMVFAARSQGPVEKRYRKLREILAEWLPPGWTQAETLAEKGADITHAFRAEDGETGTKLSLILGRNRRLYLLVRRE